MGKELHKKQHEVPKNSGPSKNFKSSLKEQGQLSIFLGVSLMVIFSLLAFITNVGLFVRARINLQNAADAAAYAGAATQARLLSQMAYLNWEMRVNYKEWLFKYYVLGMLANPDVRQQGGGSSIAPNTSFRVPPFQVDASNATTYQPKAFDPYNLPSVCIQPGGGTNICGVASVPGLPRFNTVGLPSVSEKHEEFLNAVVTQKANDCAERTKLNFGTAMIWTFGQGGGSPGSVGGGFQIAADRVGFWPRAMELAFRMRNLEFALNRPPAGTICRNAGTGCSVEISQLQSESSSNGSLNERPIKAFLTAEKNLDGGVITDHWDLKNDLQLTEIRPASPPSYQPKSLDGYFIPSNASYNVAGAGGQAALTKNYVDLQILPMHYVIMFSAFVPVAGADHAVAGVSAEAGCNVSKTAIPVPGAPVGFVKNPRVVTYYAVKVVTKYQGLFFPFKGGKIELKTYAAAKPFGGRIGPRVYKTDGSSVKGRSGSSSRTAGFAVGIENPGSWEVGKPIPTTSDFYVTQPGDVIGGVPGGTEEPKFSVPNMIYTNAGSMDIHEQAGQFLILVPKYPAGMEAKDHYISAIQAETNQNKGLYEPKQYEEFFKNLGAAGAGVSADQVLEGILKARRPTAWEAWNYLVPHYVSGDSNLENPPVIFGNEQRIGSTTIVKYNLYAPLFGTGTMFNDADAIITAVSEHLTNSQKAVELFLKGLQEVSDKVRETVTHGNNTEQGGLSLAEAAERIYKSGTSPTSGAQSALLSSFTGNCLNAPLAANFGHFFNPDPNAGAICDIRPAADGFREYIRNRLETCCKTFMQSDFTPPANFSGNSPEVLSLMSAYMPGAKQGATNDGRINHPFTGALENIAKRNYYSVKFIPISSLEGGGGYFSGNLGYYENVPFEGINTSEFMGPDGGNSQTNSINATSLSDFGGLIF